MAIGLVTCALADGAGCQLVRALHELGAIRHAVTDHRGLDGIRRLEPDAHPRWQRALHLELGWQQHVLVRALASRHRHLLQLRALSRGGGHRSVGTQSPPTGDGSQVFVTLEDRATGSNFIGVATSDGAGGYGSAQIITELVSGAYNHSPWLSRDQLRLYYTSNLLAPSPTGLDIYMATRASVSDAWIPPVIVPGVQSSSDDDGATLTSDEQIVFMSKRPGGLGGFNLWDARAPRRATRSARRRCSTSSILPPTTQIRGSDPTTARSTTHVTPTFRATTMPTSG